MSRISLPTATVSPRFLTAVTWSYLACYGVWVGAILGGIAPRGALNDALFLPFYLGASAAALRAANIRSNDPRISRGWLFVAGGWGASAVGTLLWLVYGQWPLQLLSGAGWVFYNSYYALTILGLWHFFERPRRRIGWLRLIVEGLIVATATTVLAWYCVFRHDAAIVGPLQWLDLIGILFLGETLVTVAATTVLHRPARSTESRPLAAFAIGTFCAAVADFLYKQNDLVVSPWSGPIGDLVLALGAALVISAGLMRRSDRRSETRLPVVTVGLSLLPYLAVSLVAGLLIYESIQAKLGEGPIVGLILGGAVLLVLVIARLLVSQREVSHEAAARSAQDARFRLLVQQSNDAILVVSRAGVIRYGSPAFGRMVGIGESAKDRHLADFVAPDRWGMVAAWIASAPSATLAGWQLGGPGGWLDVEAAGTDLTDDPRVGGIVLNIRDVTRRLRLEADLRQAQKLEVVGRLSSSIAHDFNNVLTVIVGNLQLLRDSDGSVGDLGAVEAAAQRGGALARQLLSIGRPTNPSPGAADLSAVVRSLEKTLRQVLPSSIELVANTQPVEASVSLNDVQIEQVLLNLTLNARDAMPTGGRLEISVDVVPPAGGTAGRVPRARLTVGDTGIGMPDDILARAFEPFFTTKPDGLGTGLGLSTVQRIISEAGGEARIESRTGEGTMVAVFLPLAMPEQAPRPNHPAPEAIPGHGRILLVDDDPLVRGIIAQFLDRSGYEVVETGDGVAALERLEGEQAAVDLVLTDLVMPRLGGVELCRRIGEHYPRLPVLCMSGTPGLRTGDEQPWSADRIIGKPVDLQGLAAKIRAALGPDER